MPVPHSNGPSTPTNEPAVVLMALRSLDIGKQRLDSVLDLPHRRQLIQSMAERVLAAAQDLPVLVVHDDPGVASWATVRGAEAFRPSRPGLNFAISAGRDLLAARGVERVIVTHADLPQAKDLRVMLTGDAVSIAPDRYRDGTNVMCVATSLSFAFAYGPGSFESHVSIARSLGVEPRIVEAPDLAFDIDHPDDLDLLQRTAPATPDCQ